MNNLFINKQIWSKFTKYELNQYIDKVFKYYRSTGFPYFPESMEWRMNEYRKLKAYDYTKCIDYERKYIKQTMHGLALCWSYHPYHYEIQCSDKRTVMDTFNSDELLKKVIDKRIKMGDNMSDNGLRKMLKIFTGTQCVSNFRPTASSAIYSLFSKRGDVTWDMSAGFGGRLLGAYLHGIKYIGTEPSTNAVNGLNQMISDFKMDAVILHQGSEVANTIPDASIDICFTSPPYYNCERYSNEPSQSYLKYPTKATWLEGYLMETIKNTYRVLKPNKHLVINIANVRSYPNLVEACTQVIKQVGFTYVSTWELALSSLKDGGYKSEPLLVFKR